MAAGIDALLRAEGRYSSERTATRADLEARRADVVIADSAFVLEHGVPSGLAAIVLVGPSADRAVLTERVPGAVSWLSTAATGEELIAAVDLAVRPPAAAEPSLVARPIATTDVRTAVAADRESTEPRTARDAAILLFGTACAATSLVMVWMALRP